MSDMSEYLRLVTSDDMDLLFEWANDDSVRKNSFSSEKILYESHKKWFAKLLEREDCRQYIYCVDDEPVGQVRVTAEGERAEIGYSICAEKRGMGYGKRMLHLVAEQVNKDLPQVQTLMGRVKPENIASSKVFLDLGYEEAYRQYEIRI